MSYATCLIDRPLNENLDMPIDDSCILHHQLCSQGTKQINSTVQYDHQDLMPAQTHTRITAWRQNLMDSELQETELAIRLCTESGDDTNLY